MSDDLPLRLAVVGVGHLGRHHARILSELPDARLAAVVDVDAGRAAQAAAPSGARVLTRVEDLDGSIDAAIVAVPTESHEAVAAVLLDRRIPVLVEKPLAASVAQADAMIARAERCGVLLAAGHTERFNPAVTAALDLVHEPGFAEVHRLGTFPERSLDVDVVFDVMIHDLDVLLATVPGEVVSIEAVGVPVLTGRVDIANVRLRFGSGCIANLTASRISRERVRRLRFFQRSAYIGVDYATQEVECYRLVAEPGRDPAIVGGRVEVARGEPLRLELEDFVDAVRTGRPPRVPALDGRRALALAERITEQIGSGH